VYVLGEEEALLVSCCEGFEDEIKTKGASKKVHRIAGQRWYIYGPTEYIPNPSVKISGRRKAVLHVESLGISAFFWQPLPLQGLQVPS